MPRYYGEENEWSDNNPNPRLRPSVDKLMSKLRTLSVLNGHPEAVAIVLEDMAWWHFVRTESRPTELWRLVQSLMSKLATASKPPATEEQRVNTPTVWIVVPADGGFPQVFFSWQEAHVVARKIDCELYCQDEYGGIAVIPLRKNAEERATP